MQYLGKTIHAKQIKSKFLPMTGFVQVRFVTHRIGFKNVYFKSFNSMNRTISKYLAMHY